MSNEQDKQHLQELAAYRFTVENLRARVAELEAQLAAAPQAVQPEWRATMKDMVDAMRLYEMDVDGTAPEKHRAMMERAKKLLATHPTQQGMEPIEQRQLAIGQAVERACKELPEGAEIQIYLERGAGTVHMTDWDGNEFDHFDQDHEDFADRINAAIDGAIAAEQFAAQAKQGEQANG